MRRETVTFGEIMLRLAAPANETLLQTPRFDASFGGGEANVAVSLAAFGLPAALVTVLPNNVVADAAVAELRKLGVDTRLIQRANGRMGIYYLEAGANQRPSRAVYDRECSTIALAARDAIDWNAVLANADWFHVTGITQALSGSAAALALDAVRTARRNNVVVSCDLHYRRNLWRWGRPASAVMPEIVENVDVLIANEEDIQLSLGIKTRHQYRGGALERCRFEEMTAAVLCQYPNLRSVAVTLRESHNASHNGWSACINDRSRFLVSRKYEITHIVDRVGAGDSFAAGLIYGMKELSGQQEALEFATAASCLKHSISGDFKFAGVEDMLSLLKNGGSGRVQR